MSITSLASPVAKKEEPRNPEESTSSMGYTNDIDNVLYPGVQLTDSVIAKILGSYFADANFTAHCPFCLGASMCVVCQHRLSHNNEINYFRMQSF